MSFRAMDTRREFWGDGQVMTEMATWRNWVHKPISDNVSCFWTSSCLSVHGLKATIFNYFYIMKKTRLRPFPIWAQVRYTLTKHYSVTIASPRSCYWSVMCNVLLFYILTPWQVYDYLRMHCIWNWHIYKNNVCL